MKTSKKENKITEEKYTKSQIIKSKTFRGNKDVVDAVLKQDKSYTKQEVNKIIENFKKGKVN